MAEIHRFEHRAMATPWVLSIAQETESAAAWGAQEAFRIIDQVEEDLSRFQPMSYVSQLGRLRAGESLQVSPSTWECLELAQAVHHETKGAFDITVRLDDKDNWQSQMSHWRLCQNGIIEVTKDDVRIDLGGIGKGFAIDEIIQFFQEHEIEHAFLDSGGSTHYARGHSSPEIDGWPASLGKHGMIALTDQALSASGFEVQGQHVVDPRTGRAVNTDRQRAWVLAGSAALADALSTAALIMSEEEIACFSKAHPDISIMLS